MEDNNKLLGELKSRELKAFVAFLASGAFVAVHKQFIDPKELFPDGHFAIKFHNWGHYSIGLLLQILFILWVLKIIWNVLIQPILLWLLSILLRFQWLLKFQWVRSLEAWLRSKNISKEREENNGQ